MAKLISTTDLLVRWKIIRPKAYLAPMNMSVCPSKYQDCENITSCYYSYLELRRVLEYQISNQYSNFHDCAISPKDKTWTIYLKVPTLPVSNLTLCLFFLPLLILYLYVECGWVGEKPMHQGCVLCWQYAVFRIFLYSHKLATRTPDQIWIQI